MNPLQAAAVAGQLAGAACDMLLDWIAPLPEQKPWPDGEQPLIDEPLIDEPPLTGDELVAVRQLIEERSDISLAETADALIKVGAMTSPCFHAFGDDHPCARCGHSGGNVTAEPMPTWVGDSDGFNTTPAADDGTAAAGGAAPVDTSAAGAAHSKAPAAADSLSGPVGGAAEHLSCGTAAAGFKVALTIAAAIGLREYAESNVCEAPVYWRHIADQLDPK